MDETDAIEFVRPGDCMNPLFTPMYDEELGDYMHIGGYLRIPVSDMLEGAHKKRVHVEFNLTEPGLNIFQRRIGAPESTKDMEPNVGVENAIQLIIEKDADAKHHDALKQLKDILLCINREKEACIYYYSSGALTIDLLM